MASDCTNAVYSDEYVDFMIELGSDLDEISKIENSCSFQIWNEFYNALIPVSKVPTNFFERFGYGSIPNTYGTLDIQSLDASDITRVQNIPKLQLKGAGILIGIVDTGIDYRHEAFLKTDRTSKVYSIWDQSINTENSPFEFGFGTEYSQAQINEALSSDNPLSVVPSVDLEGHGTMLAGLAAGNRNDLHDFSGVAPDAELVIVKLKPAKQYWRDFWCIPEGVTAFQKNDVMMGLRYIENIARRTGRPVSIIIGIGTSQGGHDERGMLSNYISQLATRSGVAICIAGGNEGNSGHHHLGTVQNNLTTSVVEINVEEGVSGFAMEFWGQTPSTFTIDIKSPGGEYIPPLPQTSRETREIRFIFERTIIYINYELVESQSGDQLILLRIKFPTKGLWTFQVHLRSDISLRYHVWMPIQNFLSKENHFVESDPEYTLTSPGNTFIPIVNTAYNYRTQALFIQASRGYMRNDNIAPTLAAPGVDLIAPVSGGGYSTFSGTSLAAAHTGGVAALMLEWAIVQNNIPKISTVEIRNLLIRGAKRDASRVYPNKEWGYGILDFYNVYDIFRSNIS